MFGMTWAKALMGFLVPALTSAIMGFFTALPGVSGGMTLKEFVPAVLTALVVYLVPNAKKD